MNAKAIEFEVTDDKPIQSKVTNEGCAKRSDFWL